MSSLALFFVTLFYHLSASSFRMQTCLEVLKAYLPGQKVEMTLLKADGDLVSKDVKLASLAQ